MRTRVSVRKLQVGTIVEINGVVGGYSTLLQSHINGSDVVILA